MHGVRDFLGSALRPNDPRRFLVEAMIGSVAVGGLYEPSDLAALEARIAALALFAGLAAPAVRLLVELANDAARVDADAATRGVTDRQVHLAPGLFRRAESSVRQYGFDIFTGAARDCNLEIVNRGGTVHGERSRPPMAHQVEQDRRETALNHMSAKAPDDRLAVLPRGNDRVDDSA